jgi:hypothetical protein
MKISVQKNICIAKRIEVRHCYDVITPVYHTIGAVYTYRPSTLWALFNQQQHIP